MGRTLIQACANDAEVTCAAATEHSDSGFIGTDAGLLAGSGANSVLITATLDNADFDVLIDFTRPEPTLANIIVCEKLNAKAVIGTTGFSDPQKDQLKKASEKTAIVFAPNMSVGVSLTFKLLQLAAQTFGDSADVEIIEAHHKHKVDAPSGTALGMGEAVAKASGRSLDTHGVFARHGHTGERVPGSIGFSTIRAADIVGEHTVMFACEGERVEISHKSSSRMNYALGALRAAKWLVAHNTGLFDMQDVLNLR